MPDVVQKTFVGLFIKFLKNQIDSQLLPSDTQESVEVAIQCLQAAFDISDDPSVNPEMPQGNPEEPGPSGHIDLTKQDLFEMFQSLYIERKAENLQLAEKIKNDGNRLMKDGKYNEAVLQYNRAIVFDAKNPIFYCNRAAAYIRLGENERAVSDCKTALIYNENYDKAYGRLGIAYSNLGKYDEAQQAYAKAIELDPENQDYRNNLEIARIAPSAAPVVNMIPQLSEGLNAMLSNPNIRNLMTSGNIDMDQIQNLSLNPMIINAFGQMFSALQGDRAGGGGVNSTPNTPPSGANMPINSPNDMVQFFRVVANEFANASRNSNANPGNGTQPPQPPPPTS